MVDCASGEGPRRRVLMLTHRVPYPPNRGDRIRAYHLLKFLLEHYDVSLACVSDEPATADELAHLGQLCTDLGVFPTTRFGRLLNAARSAACGRSLTQGYFGSSLLTKTVRTWHEREPFDAVLVFCSSMFPYLKAANMSHVPAVVDLVDVDSLKWKQMASESKVPKRYLYGFEAARIRRLEGEIATSAKAVVLVSNEEAALFDRSTRHSGACGISNGVDTDYFQDNPERSKRAGQGVNLVFTGVLDYAPNVEGMEWFCRHVWPVVHPQLTARGMLPASVSSDAGQLRRCDNCRRSAVSMW